MPSLITHNFFGQDALIEHAALVGDAADERDAFLLGNQGPDPLFYAVVDPRLLAFRSLGSTMHAEKPSELLDALKRSLSVLDAGERGIGQAYALGFLCHYLLDVTAHPLVYAHEHALCDAGVPGLSRDDRSEVHAVIESELDEMLLFTRTGQTVATFAPEREVLQAPEHVLSVVSKMYVYVALDTYGIVVPERLFASSVRNFRRVQALFHSPTGMKRAVMGRLEETLRPHSFCRSMSHRAIELEETPYENRAHEPWGNPFTGQVETASFADLYERALSAARAALPAFASARFDLQAAQRITGELNFSGELAGAQLLAVENR